MTRERAILSFLHELEGQQLHGFLITLGGKTLAEGYCAPFCADEPHRMYSVSKSVVSLSIGILADEGRLSLDDRIVDYFPEWVGEDTPAMLREVTLRHMLTMSTCYDRAQYSPLGDEDWTKPFFLGKPTHPAGTLFHYDTSASQVMCALVERLTGEDILSFMQRRLFGPIGMDGPKKWLKDQAGTSQGGTGLLMTLRDFARLANFCMSDGQGLISEEYLRAATSWQIATDERSAPEERYGYGYQFWQMRRGFYMYGLAGQMALCLPEEQLVLCTTADMMLSSTGVQPIFDAFFRHLAGISRLPSDPADAAQLAATIASLRLSPMPGMSMPHESLHIELAQTQLAMTALTIRDDGLIFRVDGQDWALACSQGEWREGIFPGTNQRCISSGGWVSENRYVMHCELCDDFVCPMELYLTVNGARAALRVSSGLWECVSGWSGLAWGCVQACHTSPEGCNGGIHP